MLIISLESMFIQLIFLFVISQVGLIFAAKLLETKHRKKKNKQMLRKKTYNIFLKS